MTGALLSLLTAAKSSGGDTTFVVFLVLIALVGYFLLIRPQRQKQRRQRDQQSGIGVGDEVLTVGGIVGKVIAVDADRVTILTGGDTVGFASVGNEPTRIVLVRNAIARKIEPPLPDSSSDFADESDRSEPGDGSQAFDGHMNGHDAGHGDGPADGVESESEGTSP